MQAALAQSQQMAQLAAQGVDVGACGGPAGGMYGGFPGAVCGPGGSPLPFVPPQSLIGPNALFQSSVIPLGFSACFDCDGNVIQLVNGVQTAVGSAIEISVGNNSQFYVCGIRTFTGPGLIEITQISGGGGFNVFPGAVDAAVYNTDDCYCQIDLPCISPFSPLTLAAQALPDDPCASATVCDIEELRGALFGYWLRNLTGCSPISTLPLLGSGPMVPPSPFAAGLCPPTGPMGAYGMQGQPVPTPG